MENQPAAKKNVCWEVRRAWTCMPSIHIQPNRYQSNPHDKIYHFKLSKHDFNLSQSRNKSEILKKIKKWKEYFFFCFFWVFWYQITWKWWIFVVFIRILSFFQFFLKNGFETHQNMQNCMAISNLRSKWTQI